jgi:ElaB/YqjD/DUF883 family membrane-anchored ribosome-binding protein
METDWESHKRETAAGLEASDKSSCCGNVKTIIADKLHNFAEALGHKAADRDAESGVGKYGKQASEWLDQSAEYVRQFDYKQVDVKVRNYVREKPGRSLLISGVVGLIIGAMYRRR